MKEYLNKFKNSIIVLFFPILLFFIVGPLEIYAGNKEEFLFGIKDFLWLFLIIAIVILVVCSLLISIFPKKVFHIVLSIVFCFSILFYIQNMFLNSKLMDKAGNGMNWKQLKSTTVNNLIIWAVLLCVIIIALVLLKEKRIKFIVWTSTGLSIIQLVTAVSLVASTGFRGIGKEELVLSGEQQFQYSSGDNIIVLVLDAYARDEFIKTSNDYPEVKKCLKDFTFYDNADCHYFYTAPAMMHLLTGYDIKYDNYYEDWKTEAWNSEKCNLFYNTLHDKGYTCRLYSSPEAHTYFGDFKNLKGKYDNFTYAEPRKDYRLMATLLEKMTIYKYVPYAAKPKFEVMTYSFNDTIVYDHVNGSVAYENYEVMDSLRNKGISIDNDMDKSFTVMHIQGNHFPYTFDSDGNRCIESTPEDVQRGLSVLLETYFNELKKNNLYEDATIIVTADHGLEFSYYEPQPILLIKRKGETHDELIVNSSPVSHDDFMATIIDIIEEDYSKYGTSIYDYKEGDLRLRQDNFSVGENDEMCIFSYTTDEEELANNMKKMICESIEVK